MEKMDANGNNAKYNMNFGRAVEEMKKGKRVARAGWNGKGMWLRLENMSLMNPPECCNSFEILPSIAMKTADDKYLIGWLASQTDMLADDWKIVE